MVLETADFVLFEQIKIGTNTEEKADKYSVSTLRLLDPDQLVNSWLGILQYMVDW